MSRTAPHVILGAGCAGLSLAVALREAGLDAPIVLLDRRTAYGRDRTWCLWDTPGVRFTELATHRWPAWQTVSPTGVHTRQDGRGTAYLHLRADDVYGAALARLDDAGDVELRLGTRVTVVREADGCVVVGTDAGPLRAAHVYDALGGGGPLRALRPPRAGALRQAFLGQEVRTDGPVFDPGVATLMDFRIDRSHGVRFVYVLPFAADRALVEDTSIGTVPVPAARRRAAIRRHLREHHGVSAFAVEYEERGVIPMTTAPWPVRIGARVSAVGLAGGAARPSSGYAFARIQAQVDAVARAVVAGAPVPTRTGSARLELLDRIFLDVLRADPDAFPATMAALLGGTPGDVVARFMNDCSTPADEARLVAAMPPLPFARAAVGDAPALALGAAGAVLRRALGQ